MIYSHKHRIGFIHIPKAAGMSIRQTLREMYPGAFYEAPTDHMHMQGRLIRDLVLGKFAFSRIRWFAVTRHPVHTIWASYQRTKQIAKDHNRRGFSAKYCDYLDRCLKYKSFDEYTREAWLNPERHLRLGGLWTTYCCDWDGQELPVRILRFDNLADDWNRLLADWRLPQCELRRVNTSGSASRRDLISDTIYSDIMTHCHIDCQRFSYE